MRKVTAISAVSLGTFLLSFSMLLAAPDPRDSVIIESKTISNGTGHPWVTVRVFITNKDSLAGYVFPLIEKSQTGGAYMTLGWPREFDSVVTPLTNTLRF